MIPVILLTRNLIGTVVLLGIGFVLFLALSTPTSTQPSRSDRAVPKGAMLIDPVSKYEDGNSAFSADLLKKMEEFELSYYSQIFFWTMQNAKVNQTHRWSKDNIAGEITVTHAFRNKRDVACKKFNETLKVHEIQQTLNGIACAKPDGTWCKLKHDATPACNLSAPQSFWDGLF